MIATGAALVIRGDLGVGQLVARTMLAGYVTGPILRLAQTIQQLGQMRVNVGRVGDIAQARPERPASPSRLLACPPRHASQVCVALADVRFS